MTTYTAPAARLATALLANHTRSMIAADPTYAFIAHYGAKRTAEVITMMACEARPLTRRTLAAHPDYLRCLIERMNEYYEL